MGLLDRFKGKPSEDEDDDDGTDDVVSGPDDDADVAAADDARDDEVAEALAGDDRDEGDGDGTASDGAPSDASEDDTDIRAAVAASLEHMEASTDEDDEDDDDDEDDGEMAARLRDRLPGGRAGLIAVAVGAFVFVAAFTGGIAWLIVGGSDEVAEEQDGVVVGLALPPPSGGLTPPTGGGLNAIGIGAGSEMAAAQDAGLTVGTNSAEVGASSAVPNPDSETVAAEGLNAFAVDTGTARQAGADITVAMTTSAAFDIMIDRGPDQPLRTEPDPDLLERVDGGILVPKIAAGRTSFETYSRPANPPEASPRIAIVVTGLGHSRAATEAAIRKLPGPVTLSFDVYASGLDSWLAESWAQGHEVLLSLPMESEEFPNEDAGPLALRTNHSPETNQRLLNTIMGRFKGYIGMRTAMGSKFMSVEEHIKPVLETLKGRGLMILESDRDPRSLVPRLATEMGLARAFLDVELDVSPARGAIANKLVELESIARQRGAAVGITHAVPSALEVIDAWINDASTRGFAVVPLSNIAGARRSGS